MDEIFERFLIDKNLVQEFEEYKKNWHLSSPNIKLSGRLMFGDGDGWHYMDDAIFTKEDWSKITEWANEYCKKFDPNKCVVPFGDIEGTNGALSIGDLIGKSHFNEIEITSTQEEAQPIDWNVDDSILEELIDTDTGECYWRDVTEAADKYLNNTPFYAFTFVIYAIYYFKTHDLREMPDADWV